MINRKNFIITIIIYILFDAIILASSVNIWPLPTSVWLYFIIHNIFITCTAGYMEKYCIKSPDRLCRAMKKAFYNIKISSLFGLQAVVSIFILDINLNENNYALIALYAIVLLFYIIIAMWYYIKILCDNYYIIKYIILKLFHNK